MFFFEMLLLSIDFVSIHALSAFLSTFECSIINLVHLQGER